MCFSHLEVAQLRAVGGEIEGVCRQWRQLCTVIHFHCYLFERVLVYTLTKIMFVSVIPGLSSIPYVHSDSEVDDPVAIYSCRG